MRNAIYLVVSSFSLVLALLACSDHQLGGPLSPVHLRLKTVQGNILNAVYTYDAQNRLATITRTSGNLFNRYYYDDASNATQLFQYPNPADQTMGSVLVFPTNRNGLLSFAAYTYGIVRSTNWFLTNSRSYSVEQSGELKAVQWGPGNVATSADPITTSVNSFTYTGEDITTRSNHLFTSGNAISEYTYDDKLNPFFGSTDPDVDDIQRFSRHNVIRIMTTYPAGPTQTVVYQYEYNQQGLMTKRTALQGDSDGLICSYEAY